MRSPHPPPAAEPEEDGETDHQPSARSSAGTRIATELRHELEVHPVDADDEGERQEEGREHRQDRITSFVRCEAMLSWTVRRLLTLSWISSAQVWRLSMDSRRSW